MIRNSKKRSSVGLFAFSRTKKRLPVINYPANLFLTRTRYGLLKSDLKPDSESRTRPFPSIRN
ncbi:hypothetical protein BES34_018410 [Leptospira inadai serovar Lyme]|uniref:Uncharacterized protein n=1 Tax=Leptospira inadai serovar Lyme TaxID=293084 RepID=A0ABX4YE39_9LEPT|nr:hypothetical protein BES34_018410 [Leptospira inadai serovar Lyme]